MTQHMDGDALAALEAAVLGPHGHEREDESDDSEFYRMPRMVAHIDEEAIAEVTTLYRDVLAPYVPRGRVLDLMSSRFSHLPNDMRLAEVVGLGMNADELAENPHLSSWVIHSLNRDPRLPFDDQSFDAVINTVSVQYLQRPIRVFHDVARVLRPGGPHAVVFSNRMFPTKAIRAWTQRSDDAHIDLVRDYFAATQMYGPPQVIVHRGRPARWPFPGSDPIYAVIAHRAQSSAGHERR